jgi:hypothetical protein
MVAFIKGDHSKYFDTGSFIFNKFLSWSIPIASDIIVFVALNKLNYEFLLLFLKYSSNIILSSFNIINVSI